MHDTATFYTSVFANCTKVYELHHSLLQLRSVEGWQVCWGGGWWPVCHQASCSPQSVCQSSWHLSPVTAPLIEGGGGAPKTKLAWLELLHCFCGVNSARLSQLMCSVCAGLRFIDSQCTQGKLIDSAHNAIFEVLNAGGGLFYLCAPIWQTQCSLTIEHE